MGREGLAVVAAVASARTGGVSDDGCELTWSGGCPITGDVGGTAHEAGHLAQVSDTRIEGTIDQAHDRDDGAYCATTITLVYTKAE